MKPGQKEFDEEQNKERQRTIDVVRYVAAAVFCVLEENPDRETYGTLAEFAWLFICLVVSDDLAGWLEPEDFFEECGFDQVTVLDIVGAFKYAMKEEKKGEGGVD